MSDAVEPNQLAVVIGRFQPFHRGHLALLEQALNLAPRALFVVGSAGGPRQVRNPFTASERIDSIRASLSPEQRERVRFATVRDYYDEPRWARAVKATVARERAEPVVLVGFRKDESSSYLSLFPEWREQALPRQAPIDATELRRLFFTRAAESLPDALVRAVPAPVTAFLEAFRGSADFVRLCDELDALDKNREEYGQGPFVTVDALVTRADHALLIQRGRAPGRGLWAIPGGFLDGAERLLTAALRELREETGLRCSDAELQAALRDSAVFDHPQRSQRGRTITHAYHFALPRVDDALPEVVGADDAQAARWFPVGQLASMADQLFEDHFQILDHFLGLARD